MVGSAVFVARDDRGGPSAEDSTHRRLGPVGHPVEVPARSKSRDGVSGDDRGGHRKDQADDAADQATQRGDDARSTGGCSGCGP